MSWQETENPAMVRGGIGRRLEVTQSHEVKDFGVCAMGFDSQRLVQYTAHAGCKSLPNHLCTL